MYFPKRVTYLCTIYWHNNGWCNVESTYFRYHSYKYLFWASLTGQRII